MFEFFLVPSGFIRLKLKALVRHVELQQVSTPKQPFGPTSNLNPNDHDKLNT